MKQVIDLLYYQETVKVTHLSMQRNQRTSSYSHSASLPQPQEVQSVNSLAVSQWTDDT